MFFPNRAGRRFNGQMSPSSFDLAWRLRPASWRQGKLSTDYKELARRVLVDGEACTAVAVAAFTDGPGVHAMRNMCRDVFSQLVTQEG